MPQESQNTSAKAESSQARHKQRELYIGLMSGTSIDGIDGVLIEISPEGRMTTLATESMPWSPQMKAILNDLCVEYSLNDRVKNMGLAANAVATAEATVCVLLMEKARVNHDEIRAIGAHGQTIRHHPELSLSIQIDNGPLLANLTDIDAITNFRAADLANLGEGAPLTQAFHQSVLSSQEHVRLVLNLGGIANVTAIAPFGKLITAFDTGPANTLLDYVCRTYLNQPYDPNGELARKGVVDEAALEQLMQHAYLKRAYPKSTGREDFNLQTIEFMLKDLLVYKATTDHTKGDSLQQNSSKQQNEQSTTQALSLDHLSSEHQTLVHNILRTLTEYTVRTSINAIKQVLNDHPQDLAGKRELIVCGGGAFNAFMLERMQQYANELDLNITVMPCTTLGIDPRYLEAQAFAFFAFCCSHAISLNLCSSTKAKRPSILGTISPSPQGFYARAMATLDRL